ASFFHSNYPELSTQIHTLVKKRFDSLHWKGPKITISPCADQPRFQRPPGGVKSKGKNAGTRDFVDSPIYCRDDPKSNAGDQVQARRSPSPIESDGPRKRPRRHN